LGSLASWRCCCTGSGSTARHTARRHQRKIHEGKVTLDADPASSKLGSAKSMAT
jgi:hypothetical protein